ncbi:MAG: tetratricopeptide repeat protein [Deltaproteobacteria bacterium]|nr:tetratricopeptide repeat protein [Deltaproteobacteria bacterium]
MTRRVVKYNPNYLFEDNQLVESFVVRHTDLELIVEVIRENVTDSNQHVLVIGPRGSGKTTLVLRTAAEVDLDPVLRRNWYPLILSEESYNVLTPGEFWLEAVHLLSEQTGDPKWASTHAELAGELDEERLRQRALAQIQDFADQIGKRILLIVENLNMLLGQQLSDDDAWALRHTLQNEPRLMLLATATTRFEEVESEGKAMFELFKQHVLQPLDEDDCRTVWRSITGEEPDEKSLRPIQIFTGGNLRLLTIISSFGARKSFAELMTDLKHLVDDHTEHFKSHLDALPAVERKVFVSLLELWDPATARQVAKSARLDVNKASSMLRRLMTRGAVMQLDVPGRTKWYQASERLYNIYYLMRRRSAPSRRVHAVVHFMVGYYTPDESRIAEAARQMAEEACELDPELRSDIYLAYEALLECPEVVPIRGMLFKETPAAFFHASDTPESLKNSWREWRQPKPVRSREAPLEVGVRNGIAATMATRSHEEETTAITALLDNGDAARKAGSLVEAERVYRDAVELEPESPQPWLRLGDLLENQQGRLEDAEDAYRKAMGVAPSSFTAALALAQFLRKLGRNEESLATFWKAVRLNTSEKAVWRELADLLRGLFRRAQEASFTSILAGDAPIPTTRSDRRAFLDTAKGFVESADMSCTSWDPERFWALLSESFSLSLDEKARIAVATEGLSDFKVTELQRILKEERSTWESLFGYRGAEQIREAHRSGLMVSLSDVVGARLAAEELQAPDLPAIAVSCGLDAESDRERFDELKTLLPNTESPYPWAHWALVAAQLNIDRDEIDWALEHADELGADSSEIWITRGDIQVELKDLDEAEQCYRKALALDDSNHRAWLAFARFCHERVHRYEDAERAYRKSIEGNPLSSLVHLRLAMLLHDCLSRYEEAEAEYRKAIELNPKYVAAWVKLGQLLHEGLNRLEDAEEAYGKALEISPDIPWVLVQLGQLHNAQPTHISGQSLFEKALQVDPTYEPALAALAQFHERIAEPEEAEEFSRKLTEVNPSSNSAWARHAVILERLNRFDESEAAYKKAVEIDPNDPWDWTRYGRLLFQHLARPDDARTAFQKALLLNASYPSALIHLALLNCVESESGEEVDKIYRKAVECETESASDLIALGRLHDLTGNASEAEEAFRHAVRNSALENAPWKALGEFLSKGKESCVEAEPALALSGDDPASYEERRRLIETARDFVISAGIPFDNWEAKAFCDTLFGMTSLGLKEKARIAFSIRERDETTLQRMCEIAKREREQWRDLFGDVAAEQLASAAQCGYIASMADVEGARIAAKQGGLYEVPGIALATRLERNANIADLDVLRGELLATENPFLWRCWGEAVSELKRLDQEAEWIRSEFGNVSSRNPRVWETIGDQLRIRLKRYEEAECAYRKAIDLSEEEKDSTWVSLGKLLHENLERFDDAISAYQKAIELDPKSVTPWIQLGLLYQNCLKQYDDAQLAFRAGIEADPESPAPWTRLGVLSQHHTKRYDEAEEAYRKAVSINPRYDWAWSKLGELLYSRLQKFDEAEQALKEAIRIDPKDPFQRTLLGNLYQEYLHRYNDAEVSYRKAVELDPSYGWGWSKLGHFLRECLKCPDEAERAYRRAIEVRPTDSWTWGELASLLLEDSKRHEDARALAEEGLSKQPENAGLHNSIAWAFYEHADRKYFPKAEAWAKRAITLSPDDANYHHTFACIVAVQGRGAEALGSTEAFLNNRDHVSEYIDDTTELFILIAASGCTKDALSILQASPSRNLLEPLETALQLFLGEDVKVAAEVIEVARDIVDRIRDT